MTLAVADTGFGRMRIVSTRHLDGPNVWSRRPVLEALLDLEDQDLPSTAFPGLYERLSAWLPSLIEHKCGIGERGGFLMRLRDGTWPGHILEHLGLELQALAGEDVLFGKTRSTAREGWYKMVMRSWDEMVARAALQEAWDLLQAAIQDLPFQVDASVARLGRLIEGRRLPPGLRALQEEASARGVPVRRPGSQMLSLGQGCHAVSVDEVLLNRLGLGPADFVRESFPDARLGRVPVLSVLGSGARTRAAVIAAGLVRRAWPQTALASGEGSFLGERQLEPGDRASQEGAWALLGNSRVEAAVLEASGASVVAEGLGFDRCQVALLTGHGDQRSGAALADDAPDLLIDVRRCGLDVLMPGGTAVLPASEPRLEEYLELVKEEVMLYSLNQDLPALRSHLAAGGRAVVGSNGRLLLMEGSVLIDARCPPLEAALAAGAGAEEYLGAVAAAWALGVPVGSVVRADP